MGSDIVCSGKERQLYTICYRLLNAKQHDEKNSPPHTNIKINFRGQGGIHIRNSNRSVYDVLGDKRSQRLQTLTDDCLTLWGRYKYNVILMGLKISTDVAQDIMIKLIKNIEGVFIYIDDIIMITNKGYKHHLEVVERFIKALFEVGMQVNIWKIS